jgi:16S rRNA processing protein RimM
LEIYSYHSLLITVFYTRYKLGFTKKGNSHKIKLSNKLKGKNILSQEFIVIGKVVSTQGNKGEVNVLPLTDSIDRFKNLSTVFLRNKNSQTVLSIEKIRIKKDMVILKLKDIENIEEAKTIVGSFLEVERKNAVKLPKDTYFIFEIIGLEVYTENNVFLGKVENVISTGSNDIYIVKDKNEKELFIPAIREVVKNINLEKKRITINIVDGLI